MGKLCSELSGVAEVCGGVQLKKVCLGLLALMKCLATNSRSESFETLPNRQHHSALDKKLTKVISNVAPPSSLRLKDEL